MYILGTNIYTVKKSMKKKHGRKWLPAHLLYRTVLYSKKLIIKNVAATFSLNLQQKKYLKG